MFMAKANKMNEVEVDGRKFKNRKNGLTTKYFHYKMLDFEKKDKWITDHNSVRS